MKLTLEYFYKRYISVLKSQKNNNVQIENRNNFRSKR